MKPEDVDFAPIVITNRGDVASVLADLRRAFGETCEAFDARAGFSDRYVAKLEHGDRPQGRKGIRIEPGKISLSHMGEVWLEALGARLVLMPVSLANKIGALPAPSKFNT